MSEPAIAPIAVVGMSARFPGAPDVERYWQNILEGVESIAFFSEDEVVSAGVPRSIARDARYVKARGIIDDPDAFDAELFGMPPREAELLDPQHRVFLECAWAALEDAGCDPSGGRMRVGVYAGCRASTYVWTNLVDNAEALGADTSALPLVLGNDRDFLATRVSYKLDLRGPAVTVQSGCSTSLVAVHLAVRSILAGDCDVALAGGATIRTPLRTGYMCAASGLLSPDGHCRPFDARAAGVVSGDGVGVVVLKRLAAALSDRDRIRAVILASAVNNDGAERIGYTAPSVSGQREVIDEALGRASIDAGTIGYVEAHGSGTALGDPVEVAALTQAFASRTERRQYCALGSVKANIGHLDAAAGIASFIKTVLILERGMLPPHGNFDTPNPQLNLSGSPFFINAAAQTWPHTGVPRRAAVSSLGLGGTNAHVILEEAPPRAARQDDAEWHLVPLSARAPQALDEMARRLRDHVAATTDDIGDIAYTLQVGRRVLRCRRAVLCQGRDDLVRQLSESSERVLTGEAPSLTRDVIFLLPGLGDHYEGMGRRLYEADPVFRDAFDACATIVRGRGVDLVATLHGSGRQAAPGGMRQMLGIAGAGKEPMRPGVAHPLLFAVEYALAHMWMSWSVTPSALVGYSLGEFTAACLAGVFTLDDALTVVLERAALVETLPRGAMTAVGLSADSVVGRLPRGAFLAAMSAPELSVVSGSLDAVTELEESLRREGTLFRRLPVSHAFHSPHMESIAAGVREAVRGCERRPPQIPFTSNVTGMWIEPLDAVSDAYWAAHLCRPVDFTSVVGALKDAGLDDAALLEIGPGRTLGGFIRQSSASDDARVIASSLPHVYDGESDMEASLRGAACLWVAGVALNWERLPAARLRNRVALPSYPFDRRRYWIAPAQAARPSAGQISSESGAIERLLSTPVWKQAVPDLAAAPLHDIAGRSWVVIGGSELTGSLVERLRACGGRVVCIRPLGSLASADDEGAVAVNDGEGEPFERALTRIVEHTSRPLTVVHADVGVHASPDDLSDFWSLCRLARVVGSIPFRTGIDIVALVRDAFMVSGRERVIPEHVTAWGAVKAIAKEIEGVRARLIDLSSHDGTDVDTVVAEIRATDAQPLVALRGPTRWVRTFEPVRVVPPRTPLRREGLYLITGGLGGIGIAFAGYLARRARARLVLVGRREVPPRSEWMTALAREGDSETGRLIRTLLDVERDAASLSVVRADVTDSDAMHDIVAGMRKEGELAGVIHAAGLGGGGLLQVRSRSEMARVLAPKVLGTKCLASACSGTAPDFIAFCSSLSSVVGGFGQADYGAANAFLDAFSHAQHAAGARAYLSINWGTWRDVGLAVRDDIPAALAPIRQRELEEALSPQEAVEAFASALGRGFAQVAIATQPLARLIEEDRARTAETVLSTFDRALSVSPAHRRPALATAYVPPATETERRVVPVWQQYLGFDAIGVHDNFFELGGNSLVAMQVAARLRQTLGIELPLVMLFQCPTPHRLGAAIDRLSRDTSPIASTSDAAATPIDALLGDIEQLSDEEAAALLAAGDV